MTELVCLGEFILEDERVPKIPLIVFAKKDELMKAASKWKGGEDCQFSRFAEQHNE